jgi:predicted ATP-grasp superfamily ATP-dependent carboligase
VIVGLHQNGLGVARALGRQGISVIAVDQLGNDVYGATRYAKRVSSPDLAGMGLIDTLRQVGSSLDGPGILILTLDRSVLLVSEHREQLEPYFEHSLPSDEVIQRLMNKAEMDQFARAHGFDVPRTFAIHHEDDLDACMEQIALPCILKPQVKTVAFVEHSPKKAFFIRTRDELRETWHTVAQWEPGVVVQEWIPGPASRLVFCLYYFDQRGRPLASFGGRKIRQYIAHCGTACSAEPWDDQVAYEAGVRFFQSSGYRGFGAIEFKIAPDGRYHLIEPTVGRTEHIFALAAANGINLPYLGYCDMAGLPAPRLTLRRRPIIYVDWSRDFKAARALMRDGELSWTMWTKSIARPQQHALSALDDPAPLLHHITGRAARKARGLARRVRSAVRRRFEQWTAAFDGRQQGTLGAAVVPRADPGDPQLHLRAALDWLCAAQDAGGGGVARGYSLSMLSGYPRGWQHAYPETTGYLIPTFFDCAALLHRDDLAVRACRMADWELTVQHESGGFRGGTVDRRGMPVVFNTGMVLLGLTRAYFETGVTAYRDAAARAAEFLVGVQSNDGAWRRFANVNGQPRVHAYDCLVNWGLVYAAQLLGEHRWADAARRNLNFTLTLQSPNGWFAQNALRPMRNATPLTHTIAYATAGCLEAGLLLGERRCVDAAVLTATALVERINADGFLAGEFDGAWRRAGRWSCLTGTAQMAIIWWRLYELHGDMRFADAARRATAYLRCRHEVDRGGIETRGGVAGAFPIDAPYCRLQFVNWAAKFFVDTLLLEARLGTFQPTFNEVQAHTAAPGLRT